MALTLDPVLLEVLACPAPDHGPLQVGAPDRPDADALTCTRCGRVFPVEDGIPVLLLTEVLAGPTDPTETAGTTTATADTAGSGAAGGAGPDAVPS